MDGSDGQSTFYLTTPIYYVNDVPHIGHAYTTVAADTVARYQRLRGREVYFLTGTDEHGLKVERSAQRQGIAPQELADQVVDRYRSLWERLEISHDDFIRTTEDRHAAGVRKLWELLEQSGAIYKGVYEGWYNVSDEAYVPDSQVVDGCDAESGQPLERVQEESYFFRLSEYRDVLVEHIQAHPEFIQPDNFRNEILSFLEQGLKDLSISRTTFTWGVSVPEDPDHVIYVWIDALTNYISALGYGSEDQALFERFWPADLHLIGKDILRFHAVYWPALLMAAGLPLPRQIFAHGWWTKEGQKMSKSKGNVLDPFGLTDYYGTDQVRYFLLREVPFGQDGDFSDAAMVRRANEDLANDLGNLLNRTLSMQHKYLGDEVGLPAVETDEDADLKAHLDGLPANFEEHMDNMRFHRALEAVFEVVRRGNLYVDETAPWVLNKEGRKERLAAVLANLLETMRVVNLHLWPVMPEACNQMFTQMGYSLEGVELDRDARWGARPGTLSITKPKPVFQKVQEPET
ncbi:methionine--tRNA ligase [Thiohalorhabdus methylotrophus]|uniref:Methionine--tRNA ligase n=1 Tax=Thiohalorhabdus methylotrophus TaxID=3242694 RepID=A0ABV4TZV0_9GAMM